MIMSTLKEAWQVLGATVGTIDRVAIWGAKSVQRLIGSLILIGIAGLLLVGISTNYLMAASAENYHQRKGAENANAQDNRFLVAQEAIVACDDADKAKRKTVKEACIEATSRYKDAMREMPPDLLKERLKTATYSNWLLDVNQALRFQREKRGSSSQPTFLEQLQSWTSTYWGYTAVVIALIVVPMTRHAWVVSKEQEKQSKKSAQYRQPLRRIVPAGPRLRTRLRSNRSSPVVAT